MINWRVLMAALIAVTLAATHFKAYVTGKESVLEQLQQDALANEKAARAREHALTIAKQKAEEAYEAQKQINRRAIAGAQSELGRLRDALADRAAQDPATCTRTDGAAPELELLGTCAGRYATVAQDTDELAATVTGLQAYVRGVCLAQ